MKIGNVVTSAIIGSLFSLGLFLVAVGFNYILHNSLIDVLFFLVVVWAGFLGIGILAGAEERSK